ncbi:PD-(D/E)XK nuclease family protein [Geofilum rubicundum]|uniref:PD-(D/E)XK nuclease family protein n=1 Tax=Geofilum rubicundum TaxID=472113 RepID=UPI0012F78F73|nr:PD-(D/E)XK nuclease family protein [Geofilum rubicundum]
MLHSIPAAYSSINITLGYPLKNTPAFSLVENLLAMQKTTRTTREGKTWFYHRDVLALLRHQYMKTILEEGSQSLIHHLIASNQLFIEGSRLNETPQLAAIFQKIDTTAALTTYLNELLIMVYRQLEKQGDKKLEMEFIFFLFTTIKRLSDILTDLPQQPNPQTWQSLFKKLVAGQSVPFKGEPLQGLQIMGLLETRALDFENLIIIGMNEGVFPKTTPPNSFIPFNLRKGYGLPTIDNQDAIFAYYFYRLIHRAKRIKLVYTTSKSTSEEGEMSRFLQQLYYEYPGKLKVETPYKQLTIPTQPDITATKSEAVMQILSTYLTPGGRNLSPSALSTYIECPLRFYYRYVAQINEPDSISEDLDPRVFGNLFHEMVELIYQPFVGKMVQESDLDQWLGDKARIKSSMDQVFEKNIPFIRQKSGAFTDLQGKNSLVYEILFKYIVRFLHCEKQVTPFRLHALEERVETGHPLNPEISVNLGGTIDRTDEKEGMVRILDYKTGKAGKEFREIEDLFNRERHSDNKAIFQTLLYGLIKSDNLGHNNIEPGVISVKELFKDLYDSRILRIQNKKKTPVALEEVKAAFTTQLNLVLTELFDAQTPFVQTDHKKSCGYCVFNKHCLRE